jgi:hypothetical protein
MLPLLQMRIICPSVPHMKNAGNAMCTYFFSSLGFSVVEPRMNGKARARKDG